jgi:uncharacterized membrane protein YbhN (UPF0104 family)
LRLEAELMARGETTIPVIESPDARPLERRRAGLQYALVGLLFCAVAITLVRGWNELSGYEWRIDQRAVVVALGLWVLSTLGAAACWLVVTRAFGLRLPIGPALRVYATSNLGKYLPGKVFHVFARVYLVQQQGVPVGVGTTSTVLDVLLYIAAGLVLSVFALPIALISLGGYQPGLMAGAGVAVLVGFVLLHPRVLNAVVSWIARFVPRLRGLRFELRYSTILLAFLLYMVQWLLVTAAVYASVRSVSLLSADKAPILGAIFALAYIAGLITPTPAGVGAREAVMIPLFSSFMPLPAAVVAAILNRLLQVLAETFSAGLLSLVVRR